MLSSISTQNEVEIASARSTSLRHVQRAPRMYVVALFDLIVVDTGVQRPAKSPTIHIRDYHRPVRRLAQI